MNTIQATETATGPRRALLSLREVAVLADVPEDKVRKDIETGVLAVPQTRRRSDGRLCFEWHHVDVVAAAYGNRSLNSRMRKAIIEHVERALLSARDARPVAVPFDRYIRIDLAEVSRDTAPRVTVYADGLTHIESRAGVLGGDVVFKGTRLSVAHIGKMLADGESMQNMLEDFPMLTENHLKFSQLYHRAHPPVGRPRKRSVDAAAAAR